MTTTAQQTEPDHVNNTPTPDEAPLERTGAPVVEQLELPGARKLRELDEMRSMHKRLEALEPKARKRVLTWLNAQFEDS